MPDHTILLMTTGNFTKAIVFAQIKKAQAYITIAYG
jgi:hypothetical protein